MVYNVNLNLQFDTVCLQGCVAGVWGVQREPQPLLGGYHCGRMVAWWRGLTLLENRYSKQNVSIIFMCTQRIPRKKNCILELY